MQAHQGFDLFGPSHRATLALIVAGAVLLPLAVRRLAPDAAGTVAVLLAMALVGQELVQLWILTRDAETSLVDLLPLHLCTLAVYLTAWTLVTRQPRVYELVYFWAMAGSVQALLTPDLQQAFPHPDFLLFFLGHGLVIVGVVYATIVFRLRPHAGSIPWVALITLGYAAAIFLLNLWLGTNFLYLMAKPDQPSLLDWFGPWPWYLLGLVAVGFLSLLVWYSPFFVFDCWRRVFSDAHCSPSGPGDTGAPDQGYEAQVKGRGANEDR